jgi:hypothetical protein
MKPLLLNIASEIGLFFETIASFLYFIISLLQGHVSFGRSYIKDKNVIPGKPVYILGNGPSLKTTIEKSGTLFTQSQVICVNEFPLAPEFLVIKPPLLVITDPIYWNKILSPDLKALIDSVNEIVTKKVNWEFTIMLPYSAKKWNYLSDIPGKNKDVRLKYFNKEPFLGYVSLRHLLYKKNLAMPRARNVLVAAIFLAINFGFKKIVIIGADHSWHENVFVGADNIVYFKDAHFFDEETKKYRPFYKIADKTQNFRMDELLTVLARMFTGYIELARYADYMGASVYNASEKSYIDAFKRMDITETTSL